MAKFEVTRNARASSPPGGRWRDAQQAVINVHGQRENQLASEGMVRTHTFNVPVTKYGLVKNIDCQFSFMFLHRPEFKAGFVLENQGFVFPQFLPTITASVVDWRIPAGDSDQAMNKGVEWGPHYGAKVTCTIGGHIYQRGIIQLAFTGKSLLYPVAGQQQYADFTRPPKEYDDEPPEEP